MSIVAATLLAFAVLAAQILHGGLFVPAFLVPSEVLLLLAALPALWAVTRNPAPAAPAAFGALVVLATYLIWRCAQAPDQFRGRAEMGQVLAGGMAFAIGYGALTNSRARTIFLGIVLAGALGQAIIGFLQFVNGGPAAPLGWFSLDLKPLYDGRFATRAHGLFVNPNQFSWLMGWASLSCIALAAWARVPVITRVILVYLALVFVTADMLSGSRGGLLSLLVGGGVFGVISIVGVVAMLQRGRLLIVGGAVLLMGLCLGFGWYVYTSNWMVQGRIDSMLLPDVREWLLEHAVRQFEAAPLVGMGPGMFIYAARLYRTGNQTGDAIFAHDDWAQTLVEYGFVGFALVLLTALILLGGGVQRFFSKLNRQAVAGDHPFSNSAGVLLAAITTSVAFFVHSFTDFNLHIPANALLAGATLGLLAGTGGDPASARCLPAGVLRTFTLAGMASISVALGFFVWRHGYADCQALLAGNAYERGDIRGALAHADQGLKFQPQDAGLQAIRGRALYAFEGAMGFEEAGQLPSVDASKPAVEKVSEWSPEKRRALYRASADAFSTALAEQPLERSLQIELAQALVEVGRSDLARRHLIEAIRLDPAHGYAYGKYADFLYDAERLNRALRIYSLGASLPGGSYSGARAQDVREDLTAGPSRDASSADEPVGGAGMDGGSE